MALSGHNGRNESRIGFSYGLDLSFQDQYGNTIPVENTLQPIDMWIPRDPSLYKDVYTFVDTTKFNLKPSLQILPNWFKITSTNCSVHIQLKPAKANVAYLVMLKFGTTPVLNSTNSSYDYWQFLCPNSSQYYTINYTNTGEIDSFYQIFLNQAQVNEFKV